jgi:RNA polymerase sigma-70 factor (ECF subfamily)
MHADVSEEPASIVAEGPAGGRTDSAVIGASLQDLEQFAATYDRYSPALHRYAGHRVGGEDGDDVVAAAFLAAFRARARYDLARPDVRPWLFGILTKEIARRRRTERARLRAWRAPARTGPRPGMPIRWRPM